MTLETCQVARCEGGQCVAGDPPNDTPCDDGDPCTSGDSCTSGACAGTVIAGCGACGDGTCGSGETCESCESNCGACPPCEDAASCDDGDACTTDSCDAALGCSHADESATCADGDPCTSDSCDAALGCVYTTDVCVDGDACTDDACDGAGECAHAAIDCGDGDPCTADSCAPSYSFVSGELAGDSCLTVHSRASTWAQAEAACQAAGGHLVTIGSAAEQASVLALVQPTCGSSPYFWIGITDQDVEGTFVWAWGDPAT